MTTIRRAARLALVAVCLITAAAPVQARIIHRGMGHHMGGRSRSSLHAARMQSGGQGGRGAANRHRAPLKP